MSGGRLPKRIVVGNLEGAVRRGRGRKEKSGPIAYKRHPGVSYSGGLESDGVKGLGVG